MAMSNCWFKKKVLKSSQYEMEVVQMVLIFWFFTKDITNVLVAKISFAVYYSKEKKE